MAIHAARFAEWNDEVGKTGHGAPTATAMSTRGGMCALGATGVGRVPASRAEER